jgi:hypothetical protein
MEMRRTPIPYAIGSMTWHGTVGEQHFLSRRVLTFL